MASCLDVIQPLAAYSQIGIDGPPWLRQSDCFADASESCLASIPPLRCEAGISPFHVYTSAGLTEPEAAKGEILFVETGVNKPVCREPIRPLPDIHEHLSVANVGRDGPPVSCFGRHNQKD